MEAQEIIHINPKAIENKLSLIRRYIVEILIVVLAGCVFFQYRTQEKMNLDIIQFYKIDRNSNIEQISRNNSIIETNSIILRDIRQTIREVSEKK